MGKVLSLSLWLSNWGLGVVSGAGVEPAAPGLKLRPKTMRLRATGNHCRSLLWLGDIKLGAFRWFLAFCCAYVAIFATCVDARPD